MLDENLKHKIDRSLAAFLDKEIYNKEGFEKYLYELLKQYVCAGGKRLRPMLLLNAYKSTGQEITQKIIDQSICVELYHASTLIHDDIMDEDTHRRGHESVFESFRKYYIKRKGMGNYHSLLYKDKSSRFGMSMGILGGNIMAALSIKPLNDIKAISIMTTCAENINIGQFNDTFLELENQTEYNYMKMIEAKTAELFVASVQIGLILGEKKDYRTLSEYARNVAIAFQLQDDLLDISEEAKKGHKFGSDIKQGKQTLLVIKAFERANQKQKKLLMAALGNSKASQDKILKAVKVIKDTGAIDYVRNLSIRKIDFAKRNTKDKFFLEFADFMISRNI